MEEKKTGGRSMIVWRLTATAAVALLLAAPAGLAEEAWTAGGFEAPESVVYDSGRDVLYVSNIVGEPLGKDGAGYISRLATDGTVREMQWIGGLDAPKGMVLAGDTLYVSDIDRLVAIDLERAEISGSWPAEGAVFLNDTAVDAAGRVYVSDMMTDRIYVLDGDSVSVWLEDEALTHPNGLEVQDGALLVAAWGAEIQEDFTTKEPGHLLSVDLATKAISVVGDGPGVGNLDGIEPDGAGGWLTTDWIAGGLYRIAPDGTAQQLLDLSMGSADLEYLPDQKLAIIPMMLDGVVTAHRID
jgi:sugar lactone lactonase YvrE